MVEVLPDEQKADYILHKYLVVLYESETWVNKEECVIRVQRNCLRMDGWMFNVRHKDRISAEVLRTRLKSKNMMNWLQDRKPAMIYSSRKNGRECFV